MGGARGSCWGRSCRITGAGCRGRRCGGRRRCRIGTTWRGCRGSRARRDGGRGGWGGWAERLARLDAPATLTQSLGRPPVAEAGVHHLQQSLGAGLSGRLRAAGQRGQVTLNTLMQGAWAVLLSRYGHRRQVAFGATVSGRPAELAGVERMLGLFINSLPVWVDVPGDADVAGWLQGLQRQNSERGA